MALAYVSLAVGIVGIVVPGLPTTPLVLLAALHGERGSPQRRSSVRHTTTLSPMGTSWEAERTVSAKPMGLAKILMSVCAPIRCVWGPGMRIIGTTVAIMAIVAVWLWRRPEPGRISSAASLDEATTTADSV